MGPLSRPTVPGDWCGRHSLRGWEQRLQAPLQDPQLTVALLLSKWALPPGSKWLLQLQASCPHLRGQGKEGERERHSLHGICHLATPYYVEAWEMGPLSPR